MHWWKIDLAPDSPLPKLVLRAIEKKWETPAVTIDTTVASVSRIGRLLGTHNYKGGHIGRQATIIDAPGASRDGRDSSAAGSNGHAGIARGAKAGDEDRRPSAGAIDRTGHGSFRPAAQRADRKGPCPATRHVLVAGEDRAGAGCQHRGDSQRQGDSIRLLGKPRQPGNLVQVVPLRFVSAPARTTRRTGSRYTRPRASLPAAITRNVKARACSISWRSSPRSWRPKPQKATTTPTGSRRVLQSAPAGHLARFADGYQDGDLPRGVRGVGQGGTEPARRNGSSTPWGSRRRRTSPPKWSTTPIRRPLRWCSIALKRSPLAEAERTPDASEYLLFNNGLLHVPTYLDGKANYWVDPTSDYFSLAKLPYDFDPHHTVAPTNFTAYCQYQWADANVHLLLEEIMGDILMGDLRQRSFYAFLGKGFAGKSAVVEGAFEGLVGEHNRCAVDLAGFAKDFGLEGAIGKKLILVSEAGVDFRYSSGIVEKIKRITGGDPISVNRKNKSILSVRLNAKILAVSNHLLRMIDDSGAIVRPAGPAAVHAQDRGGQGRQDLSREAQGRIVGHCAVGAEGLEAPARQRPLHHARFVETGAQRFAGNRLPHPHLHQGVLSTRQKGIHGHREALGEVEGLLLPGARSEGRRKGRLALPRLNRRSPSCGGIGSPWPESRSGDSSASKSRWPGNDSARPPVPGLEVTVQPRHDSFAKQHACLAQEINSNRRTK